MQIRQILLVDDDVSTRKYFEKSFSNRFSVLALSSGKEAIDYLDAFAPRVAALISDQRMPKLSGADLFCRIRSKFPHVVRILTSAYTDPSDIIDAINQGAIHRYIKKPWDMSSLDKQMRVALRLCELHLREKELLSARRASMIKMAGYIAHEIRTPIVSMAAAVKGVENFLPDIIAVYEKAKAGGMKVPFISKAHLDTMRLGMKSITLESEYALSVIQMLLMNIKRPDSEKSQLELLSIQTCLSTALERYPFKDKQQALLSVNRKVDFQFYGNKLFTVHLFFNLLNNAIKALSRRKNQGIISIRTEEGERANYLYFKDTGSGISPEELSHIFDEFSYDDDENESGSPPHVGLGLAFCRHTMQQIGGEITVRSVLGEYSEFILIFPVFIAKKLPRQKNGNILT